jgi:hypothetical protein
MRLTVCSTAGYRQYLMACVAMGCQGEVKIQRHDDYDRWGIQIMVAFRDGDQMIPLTGSRQSGGVSDFLLSAFAYRQTRNARCRPFSTS